MFEHMEQLKDLQKSFSQRSDNNHTAKILQSAISYIEGLPKSPEGLGFKSISPAKWGDWMDWFGDCYDPVNFGYFEEDDILSVKFQDGTEVQGKPRDFSWEWDDKDTLEKIVLYRVLNQIF